MKKMAELERKLQKNDRHQAVLYLFCNFTALMLVTAYSAMMQSVTVQTVFPEGGDSRKQMYMVFGLTLFGCVVFTLYASSLFFRKKSRQLGILMALGASAEKLAPGLFREVLFLSCVSGAAGTAAGVPFVYLLWNLFRILIVDSEEMKLTLDWEFVWIPALLLIFTVLCVCLMAYGYLKRTDIISTVQEEHKNELAKNWGRWCGPVGIVLTAAGAVLGYFSPQIYMKTVKAYPPDWLNGIYFIALAGLYLVMLHTVVHGWRFGKKNRYKNLIARSMMKFQGRQTVNNLLVISVLIAGGVFALFYIPALGSSVFLTAENLEYDYSGAWRIDQQMLTEEEIRKKAETYGILLKDWKEEEYVSLGMGSRVETERNGKLYLEYREFASEGRFISETAFASITGNSVQVEPGTYCAAADQEEGSTLYLVQSADKLTNMTTMEQMKVSFAGYVYCNTLSDRDTKAVYVLDDQDYKGITQGAEEEWRGKMFFFNVEGEDSYAFAKDFFYSCVDCFGPECEIPYYYDRVKKYDAERKGEIYWGDTEAMTPVSYDRPDSTDFRTYWAYMPKSRILDKNDTLPTYAVFFMMFIFASMVCFASALVIGYTRCRTVAVLNRYVFEDLKRLGASPGFLCREVRNQCGKVFQIPFLTGSSVMFLFFILIFYANDGKYTSSEFLALFLCILILAVLGGILYGIYQKTLNTVLRELKVGKVTEIRKAK